MSCFIGFGSLVNTSTHGYGVHAPVRVKGWARAWITNDTYEHAFLSVVPETDVSILGLLARVTDGDWGALDEREAGYYRHRLEQSEWHFETEGEHSIAAGITDGHLPVDDVQMYVHASGTLATSSKPILYSYLETVLFGFYRVYGARGVEEFLQTTTAWTRIRDDRKSPVYPRHVPPTGDAAACIASVLSTSKKISI